MDQPTCAVTAAVFSLGLIALLGSWHLPEKIVLPWTHSWGRAAAAPHDATTGTALFVGDVQLGRPGVVDRVFGHGIGRDEAIGLHMPRPFRVLRTPVVEAEARGVQVDEDDVGYLDLLSQQGDINILKCFPLRQNRCQQLLVAGTIAVHFPITSNQRFSHNYRLSKKLIVKPTGWDHDTQ